MDYYSELHGAAPIRGRDHAEARANCGARLAEEDRRVSGALGPTALFRVAVEGRLPRGRLVRQQVTGETGEGEAMTAVVYEWRVAGVAALGAERAMAIRRACGSEWLPAGGGSLGRCRDADRKPAATQMTRAPAAAQPQERRDRQESEDEPAWSDEQQPVHCAGLLRPQVTRKDQFGCDTEAVPFQPVALANKMEINEVHQN